MFKTSLATSVLLGCAASASAQLFLSEIEAAKVTLSHAGETDFEDGPGSLSVSRFELRGLITQPLKPANGLTIIPIVEYQLADLNFQNVSPVYPINDDKLHSLSLTTFGILNCEGSPWVYAGWARAEMASDFQDVSGDAFTFDVAAGAGYQFSENFTLGAGGAVVDINGDMRFYPGLFFNWKVSEQFVVGLYGPLFVAAYTPDENWVFSFRADSGGDIWNVTDDAGLSRAVDLTSYRLGFYADRRLTDNIWISAGAGATMGNEIRLTETDGSEIYKEKMDGGMFAQVSLRMIAW